MSSELKQKIADYECVFENINTMLEVSGNASVEDIRKLISKHYQLKPLETEMQNLRDLGDIVKSLVEHYIEVRFDGIRFYNAVRERDLNKLKDVMVTSGWRFEVRQGTLHCISPDQRTVAALMGVNCRGTVAQGTKVSK